MIEAKADAAERFTAFLPIASRMAVCSGDFLIELGKRLRCRLAQPGELIDIRHHFRNQLVYGAVPISAASFAGF